MASHQSKKRIRSWCGTYPSFRGFLFLSMRKRKRTFLKVVGRRIQILLFVFAVVVWLWPSRFSSTQTGRLLEVDETQLSINPTDDSFSLRSPMSKTRPKYQFITRDILSHDPVFQDSGHIKAEIFSVFTFSKQPSVKLLDTAYTILNQSFRNFQWIVFHSCGIESSCSAIVRRVERLDRRIVMIDTSAKMDFEGRYRSIISLLKARPTKFFTFLQEGDMFELTALEKAAWLFSSNPGVSFITTHVRELRSDDIIWKKGFHTGMNPFHIGEDEASFWIMGKSNALLRNRCIVFNEDILYGDGTVRKCLQDSTDCGVTIPEVLRWSQQNASTFMETIESSMAPESGLFNRLQEFGQDGKDNKTCSFRETSAAAITDELSLHTPFENVLQVNKGVLFIIPWMDIGGADIANLNLLQEFTKRGYRVTVVCTLMQVHGSSRALESLFLRFSHDLFTIPNIIRVVDAPRFLSNIIRSRNIELVLLSNAELGYSVLPYLTQTHRSVKFVDYVHNEQPNWRQGGYPMMSSKGQKHLDMTFASSKSAIKFMVNSGKDEKRAQLGHLGIRLEHLQPFDNEKQSFIRRRLGIPAKAILISFVGRTVHVKQPMVVLKAFARVARTLRAESSGEDGKISIHLLIAGDGEGRNELELESTRDSDVITFRPRVDHNEALEFIGASDIFCLPSLSEGISFATAEAMALGVATITSNIGGFPELIGKNGEAGIMFTPTGDEEGDVLEVMLRMEQLIRNDGWRRGLQKRAERRVRRNFDASVAIPDLVTRILRTRLVRGSRRKQGVKKVLKRQLLHYRTVNGPVTDFKQIQIALAIRERVGYGSKYQKSCGEYGERWTKIIDALERGSSCAGYTLDLEALRRSALSQCGRTRIANLEDRNNSMGWQMLDKCDGFVPVVL